jgi:hypothetical protein
MCTGQVVGSRVTQAARPLDFFQEFKYLSIAAKNGAILAGEKEPWCGLRNGLLQG